MKKIITVTAIAISLGTMIMISQSCSSTKTLASSGSELWSNNCGRCHNAPPSSSYTAEQWEVIGDHMRLRASITSDEVDEIVAFLQSSK